jgi:hypothetical protein
MRIRTPGQINVNLENFWEKMDPLMKFVVIAVRKKGISLSPFRVVRATKHYNRLSYSTFELDERKLKKKLAQIKAQKAFISCMC